MTPQQLLGVSREASPERVRAAFAQRVRAAHPDTSVETGVGGTPAGGDTGAGGDIGALIAARDLLLSHARHPASTPPVRVYRRRRVTGWLRPDPRFRHRPVT